MNFSELPPSEQWAALKYRGEQFAEVWFKPEDAPLALRFRIPRSSFQMLGVGQRLTIENLIKSVGIPPEEVESWRDEGESPSGMNEPRSELRHPLTPPPPTVTHLILTVRLKPPPETVVPNEGREPEIPEATWQFLAERWNAILTWEVSVETLRISLEGLRTEMEAAASQSLPLGVKNHATSADMVLWKRAKSRIHFTVPKVREFIHRATWATGTPERKKLAELFEKHIQPRIPFPQLDEVMVQFEGVLKDRQTLHAQGTAVSQEGKRITAECQGALRTLQSNAAANASRKKR